MLWQLSEGLLLKLVTIKQCSTENLDPIEIKQIPCDIAFTSLFKLFVICLLDLRLVFNRVFLSNWTTTYKRFLTHNGLYDAMQYQCLKIAS